MSEESATRVILCSCPPDQASELVRALLQERLIGCANILPGARAHYWWDGQIQADEESVLLMETPASRAEQAAQRIVELHPYDVPKVITLSAERCNSSYEHWLRQVTEPKAE